MGTDRRRDHGGSPAGMTVVQRGLKCETGIVTVEEAVSHLPPVISTLKEAAELSSLKSQLQDLQVPLFAVIKENLGKELDCFKKFFSGKVLSDQKVCFYTHHLEHGL